MFCPVCRVRDVLTSWNIIEDYPKKLGSPVIARSETTKQSSWIATARCTHLAMTKWATILGKFQ
jgi:hypothetical protein